MPRGGGPPVHMFGTVHFPLPFDGDSIQAWHAAKGLREALLVVCVGCASRKEAWSVGWLGVQVGL